ncbi:TetR/AcrR family transcriptional regulator [Candidatus Protofrankia californiensis]|uniref:TetR/AcrR family transcriptional regulator n=1 Tax=Candidatus Protofrankia californiensis TaxID=1839754 RepID=UPI0010419E75|nr:TetR/AcrR family transcriptional regulator [Candidatus Protofrankia californiensis]
MRADAQRNRELIAATALDLFARHGAGVSMDEIARAAGLGVGTLYRHFPDRQALLESIAADTLRRLLTSSHAEAAKEIPRWQVLLQIVENCAGLPLALVKSLTDETPADPQLSELVRELDVLFEQVVERAQEEKTLRRDIPAHEVVRLLNVAVCRPGARADDHLTTVMLDGLSTSNPVRRIQQPD